MSDSLLYKHCDPPIGDLYSVSLYSIELCLSFFYTQAGRVDTSYSLLAHYVNKMKSWFQTVFITLTQKYRQTNKITENTIPKSVNFLKLFLAQHRNKVYQLQ